MLSASILLLVSVALPQVTLCQSFQTGQGQAPITIPTVSESGGAGGISIEPTQILQEGGPSGNLEVIRKEQHERTETLPDSVHSTDTEGKDTTHLESWYKDTLEGKMYLLLS